MFLFFYIIHIIFRGSFALSLNGKSPVEASSLVSGDIVYIIMGKFEDKSTTASETSSTDDKTLQVLTDIYTGYFCGKFSFFQQPSTSKKSMRKAGKRHDDTTSYFPDIHDHIARLNPSNQAEASVALTHITFLKKGFALVCQPFLWLLMLKFKIQ